MILVIAILMLILSAMFSGSEIAFVSASKLKIELKKKDGSFRGKLVDKFYQNPAEFIGGLLVGNNVVLVIFSYLVSWMVTPYIASYLGNEFIISLLVTIFITFIVLIFGEFLPKTVFRLQADRFLIMLALPLRFFQILFLLPSKFMNWITKFFLTKILKMSEKREIDVFTRNDLEYIVKFGGSSQKEENVQQEMFENALSLQDVKVRVILIPRTEIVYIDKDATHKELIELFKESGFSRILVVKETLDNVIGYVHHIKLMETFEKVEDITLPIIVVPETLRVNDLLNRFILRKQSIACVVDEYGSVSGLATMEDVLEEIFGEIEDEHDEEEFLFKKISDVEFLFIGRVEIDWLNKKFDNIKIPEGEYNTLSGFLVSSSQKIPDLGEEIIIGNYRFLIEEVSDKKIEKIRLFVLEDVDLDD